MKRLLVLALAFCVINTSTAFAGETLLQSATRHAREAGRTAAATAPGQASVPVLAQQGPGLESSGMGKGMKWLIISAVAVGVAATMYTIDHKVEDNTPSSHGLREDLN